MTIFTTQLRRRAFALILATPVLFSVAHAQEQPTGPINVQTEGPYREADWYASAYSVSRDEATRRLDLQDDIAALNARLEAEEGATFAGLWVEHQPEHRITVAFTRGGEETVQRLTAGSPLAGLLRVQVAQLTLAQLEDAQLTAFSALRAAGVRADAGIHYQTNRAEVYVSDVNAVRALISSGLLQLPNGVELIGVNHVTEYAAEVYGGLFAAQCTSAFGVRHSNGTLGIASAAHCPDSQTFNGVATSAATASQQLQSGSYDVQWHAAPGNTVRNLIWDGSTHRTMTTAQVSHPVGNLVCKYGKTTAFTCGTIQSNRFLNSRVPNSTNTWVQVRNNSSLVMTDDGDSGGPVFINNSIAGIISVYATFASGHKDMVYMPVNYISGLSLSAPAGI